MLDSQSEKGKTKNRYDSETTKKDEEIESNLSILAPCIETWRAFQNGGVGGIC